MKILLILVLFLVSVSTKAREVGVGFMLGNPTGLSGKYWLDEKHAWDGGFGMSLGHHTNGSLHGDYLIHNKGAFYFNDEHPLDLYFGIGGRMEFDDSIELGLRAPVGVVHELKEQPLDLFAEVAPIVDFIGKRGLELSLGFGARYFFK